MNQHDAARPGLGERMQDDRDAQPGALSRLLRRLAAVSVLATLVSLGAAAAYSSGRLGVTAITSLALGGAFLAAIRVDRRRGPAAAATVVAVSLLAAGVPLTLASAHVAVVPLVVAVMAVLIALPYHRPQALNRLSMLLATWTAVVVSIRELAIGVPHDLPGSYVAGINIAATTGAVGVIGLLVSKVRGRLTALDADVRDAETRYRALVEQLPAVTFIDEITGPAADDVRPIYMSPQAEEMFGYPLPAWNDPRFWRSVIHPEDRERVTRAAEMADQRGEQFSAEYRIVRADGHPVWVQEESIPIAVDGSTSVWQGVIFDITVRKNAEEQRQRSFELLRRTDAERSRLLAQVVSAQEQERRRIAAEIHDDPVQKMTAVGIRLDMLRAALNDAEHMHLVDQVQDSVRLAVRRMRELMFELRPPELDRAGLAAAVREFAAQLNDPETNVRMSIDVDDRLAIEPRDEVRGVAYRIITEALRNAARHSRASQVDVSLTEVDAGLLIRVRDDGIGIDSDIVENGRPGHFGLVSVRERAEMLGGWSKIVSRTRGGTTVEAWLPVGRTISRVGLDGKRV